MRLSDALHAARFLADLSGHPPCAVTELLLPPPQGWSAPLQVWRYDPTLPPRGVVMAIHGASPMGPIDPRWVQVNRGLVRAGFRVLCPLLPSICRLSIRTSQVAELRAALDALAARPELCPEGRYGIFSVSFSGGLCLLAAADTPPARQPDAILALGAYGDMGATMEFLLGNPEADLYGFLIVLASFLGDVLGPREALLATLRAIAEDSYHRRPPRHEAHLRALTDPEDVALVRAILADPAARRRCWADIQRALPTLCDDMSAEARLDRIVSPLTLLHGETDRVIPATETLRLSAALTRLGRPHRALLTPLVSHGDAQLGPLELLRGAPPVVAAVGAWMHAVEVGRQRA